MPNKGSKSGKSSKTARVLGLLTDPESAEGAEAKAAAAAESAAESARLADDRRTQAKIRGALEMELEEAAAPARPSRSRPDVAFTDPKTGFRIVKETGPLPEFEDDGVPPESAQIPVVEPAPAPIPEPLYAIAHTEPSSMENTLNELRSVGERKPDEYICFNVTQALVEDKADKYIKMFNLCPCARCRIDVIALALSNLPPKYVVAKPDELIPRLSIYEQRYNAAVVTQVMSACRKVLDRPHHKREQQ
ncbi:MAG: hypothetical protein E7474_09155 [Ruminococcaceae bacterium]|nr:hypothetical protein [Oscillospiraceae bacterium]